MNPAVLPGLRPCRGSHQKWARMIVGDCTMSHAGDRDSRTAASQPPDRIGGSRMSTCARLPQIPRLPSSRPGTPPAPGIAMARFPFTGPGATGILPFP